MTPQNPEKPRRWQILDVVPETTCSRLVVKALYETDSHLAGHYADAAERLAGTFTGQAADDGILLPFLTLYRHAYELELKTCIKYWAGLRRKFVDHDDPALERKMLEDRLRKEHRHP